MPITVMNPPVQSSGIADMAIDIKPTRTGQNLNIGSGKRSDDAAAAKQAADSSASVKAGQTDSVTVTDSVNRLRELESKLSDLPEVDNVRVEVLRQAISEGRYQVDASAIADSLLQSDNGLV